jgi:uncharacterized protein (DUF58 family)
MNTYYLVFSGLLSFLVASYVVCRWNLRGLDVSRTAPEATHRGDSFGVTVRIANTRRFLPALSVRIESAARPRESAGYVPCIPAKRAACLTVTEQFDRRGVFPLPGLEVVTCFPFGLIEGRRRITDHLEMLVYPRVVGARTALVEQSRTAGAVPRTIQGGDNDFFSLRDYIPGDDLRRIAWRASARLGNLMVKELSHEACRSVLFVLDSRANPDMHDFEDRFEEAIEVVASLAVTLLARRYSVALLTASGRLPEGDGRAQVRKLLEAFARLEPADPTDPDPFQSAEARNESPGVVHWFVSPDPARWGERGPHGIRVLDPAEVVHA